MTDTVPNLSISGALQQTTEQQQYIRKASLIVLQDTTQANPAALTGHQSLTAFNQALDLSNLHFSFNVQNQNEEGPDNCAVRVWNLSPTTVKQLLKFKNSQLVLQAGYGSSFGVIFQGDVKQFRVGRLNNTDSFVDILAADGDFGYNQATIAVTLSAAQNNRAAQLRAINDSMSKHGVTVPPGDYNSPVGGLSPGQVRGKVMVGMTRVLLRTLTQTELSTWTIQNGVVTIVALNAFVPGQEIVLNELSGLIGVPEATQDGVKARCLINPKIKIGGTVRIDNDLINQTLIGQKTLFPGIQTPFNTFNAIESFANVANDGLYTVYVCEHVGDTRGQEWYSNLTLLAVDNTTDNVVADSQ